MRSFLEALENKDSRRTEAEVSIRSPCLCGKLIDLEEEKINSDISVMGMKKMQNISS